jgi:hypothetical protein
MLHRKALVSVAALLSHAVDGQFIPAPAGLITKAGYAGVNVRYKQVPAGICEQDPSVKSYSGFADVGENEHIFWWVTSSGHLPQAIEFQRNSSTFTS